MRTSHKHRLLVGAVTAGWTGVFTNAGHLLPFHVGGEMFIALVGFVVAGTFVALARIFCGRLMYTLVQLGRATEREATRQRQQVGALN